MNTFARLYRRVLAATIVLTAIGPVPSLDANEIRVAQGYGNQRAQQQLANPTDCGRVIGTDGLVYVCTRTRDRMRTSVFRKDGTFVKQWFTKLWPGYSNPL